MGILTGIARGIIRILLFISIALLLIAATGAHFSEKENLKPIVQEFAVSQMNASQFSEMSANLMAICRQSGKEYFDQYIPDANKTIRINCSETSEEDVKEIYKEQIVGAMIDNVYSQKCEGLSCFASPLGIATESAHSLMRNLEIIMLGAVLIFGALLFILSKGISGRITSLGSPILFAGIPYFFISGIKNKIIASMPAGSEVGGKIADAILNYLSGLFLILLFIGGVLIAAGLILRFIFKIK